MGADGHYSHKEKKKHEMQKKEKAANMNQGQVEKMNYGNFVYAAAEKINHLFRYSIPEVHEVNTEHTFYRGPSSVFSSSSPL